MKGKGIRAEESRIDWQKLMRFKRSFTEPVSKNREEGFAKAGIATFHGHARFVGPSSVQVNDEVLKGRYVVIAAGEKPADLKIAGTEHLTTSEQFLEVDELPKRILFMGGGYIAFEFAHVAVRAGAQVTIAHRGARPLHRFDRDLVDQFVKSTRELGVDVHLRTEVIGVEKGSGQLAVRVSASAQQHTFEADMVVHAAGRIPEIEDMNLDAAGVAWGDEGVKVNEFLQSVSNSAVYAAGDAAASGGPRLTPVASYEGVIVAANLVKGNSRKAHYLGVPTVVFAIPPLAAVGLNESEAHKQALKFKVKKEKTSNWFSSRRIAEKYSGFKVLVEKGTDRILGAHLLGIGAEEVINLFGVAMRSGMRATDLKHMMYAYPTRGSDVPSML
jgi:glutathione reductase (NADPH)